MRFTVILLFFFIIGCSVKISDGVNESPTHELWDSLLKVHVDDNGNVNYQGFIQDSSQFNQYLNLLSNNPPHQIKWSQDEQIAYWINAYNAFTVKMIVDHYPVQSIKDIKHGIAFVNSVWDIKFFQIGKQTLDLNNIEHGILRKEFDEPRIHFAVNCASKSCPQLRNEAYRPELLEKQLSEQAKTFLSDPTKNQIKENELQLSKIFNWFTGDFTQKGNLIDFLNQYAEVNISTDAKIGYLDYDWNLNGK